MTSVLLVHHRFEPMTGEIVRAIGQVPDVTLTVADTAEEAITAARQTEVLMGFFTTPTLLEAASQLRWIQALGSGTDGFTRWPTLAPETILTNASGLHAGPVSEAILASMFALSRRLPETLHDQQARRWGAWMPRLIHGSDVLVIGVGQIGAAIGVKCAALGARVVGISSRTDRPPGFAAIHPHNTLHDHLRSADFVLLTSSLSSRTVGLMDAAALACMKPTAYLVNTARGRLIDDVALIQALAGERIGGAALDVFNVEPLPSESPYWSLPNVIVSPHRSGYHSGYGGEISRIIVENLQRYKAGRLDELMNRVR